VAAVAAASVAPTTLRAQQSRFPERPITLICPWTPGGNTDAALRALADAMARILGNKRIIVENKPGVGGALGAQYLAQQAKPDGHTIAQIPLGVYRLPFLTKTSFNPVTDLTYIIGVAGYNFGLTVRSDAPWKTWQEFIAHAKANPDKVRYGSPGIGTSLHITMEDIAVREGIKWIHVPFKAQQSQLALLSGEVEALTGSPPWGLVEAGKVRPLTTWSANRPARAPNVPTLKEIYGIVANSPWGIAGPKGLDPQIVKILHDTIRKAMDDAVFLQQLDRFGQEIHYMSPATYSEYARHALEKEKEIVERLGLAGKT
jgi:tripartite-type tricarboxylate transporter receptor subunit TctC